MRPLVHTGEKVSRVRLLFLFTQCARATCVRCHGGSVEEIQPLISFCASAAAKAANRKRGYFLIIANHQPHPPNPQTNHRERPPRAATRDVCAEEKKETNGREARDTQ